MRQLLHSFIFILIVVSISTGQDYTIAVNQIGVGNEWRAGEVTPIQVNVTTTVLEAQAAWVQWEVPDADGDLVLWGRPITLSPNTTTSVWLYAPTRAWDSGDTVWTIRLRAWEDNEPAASLASFRFSPQSIGAMQISSSEGLIAVFGTSRCGLQGYLPLERAESKHEATKIASGLTSKDFPDQWVCLQAFDAIVWSNAEIALQSKQKQALVDWVYRGGHFIIVLPTIGDPWSLNAVQNEIPNLLNNVHTTNDVVGLHELDGIIGRNQNWPIIQTPVKVFGFKNQDWESDIPLISLKDGRVIVLQRQFGFGAVTYIGIDLSSGRLASMRLPETDVFWNRILGRRADTPSPQTMKALQDSGGLTNRVAHWKELSLGTMAAQMIAMSTTAAGRLGTVFILIVAYWLISGPLGYYVLYRNKLQRWSWVVFTFTAILFTGGTLLYAYTTSAVQTQVKHLSVVDHVYGTVSQRVTGWFSAYLPSFGRSKITLESEDNNILLPWTPPDASMTPPFIDQQEVLVDISNPPISFDQPSRSTTSNFNYEWLGGIEDVFYDRLIRVDPDNPPTVKVDHQGKGVGLSGMITNHATSALQDVTIIWVTDQQQQTGALFKDKTEGIKPWTSRIESGKTLNMAYTWRVSYIPFQSTFDLSTLFAEGPASFDLAVKSRYAKEDAYRYSRSVTIDELQNNLEMLSLYSHLHPPTYQKHPDKKQGSDLHQATRDGGRSLDFAQWFSRPCIIVMGFFHNAPIPVPISIDDEPVTSSKGVTFVRWIYPLQ